MRGFAFTLGLSTMLDVLMAYLFIRPLVILLGRNKRITEAKYIGVARGLGIRPEPSRAGGAGVSELAPGHRAKLNLWQRVHRGETTFDFAGRWKRWVACRP